MSEIYDENLPPIASCQGTANALRAIADTIEAGDIIKKGIFIGQLSKNDGVSTGPAIHAIYMSWEDCIQLMESAKYVILREMFH